MKFSLALALSILAASPALAGSGYHRHASPQADCRSLSASDQACGYGSRGDRFAVYSYDGRLIGRDPDANVRMRLRDEDWRYHR